MLALLYLLSFLGGASAALVIAHIINAKKQQSNSKDSFDESYYSILNY